MITLEVQVALIFLQQRAFNATDSFELDRIERAMDELLRSPEKTSPPAFQVRSARANAAKVLLHRRSVQSVAIEASAEGTYVDSTAEVEILDWLARSRLCAGDKRLLTAAALGLDAVDMAPPDARPRVREQLSRARSRARTERARVAA